MVSRICIFFAGTISVVLSVVGGDPLVPALCIFGDSVVDVGNNNNLLTLIKADFLPYGRDYITHAPTGRFCNGKLAIDFIGNLICLFIYFFATLIENLKYMLSHYQANGVKTNCLNVE